MRARQRMLAIPPESANSQMSILTHTGGGLVMRGGGSTDFFCGRCGRLMMFAMERHQVLNVWFTCPKCQWLNGMDIDLGWAEYVVKELEQRKLSLERIGRLLEDLKTHAGPVEQFVERNPDVGPALGWIARISVATLIAILTLLYAIYSSEQTRQLAEDQVEVAREQLEVARSQAQPRALSPDDLHRLAQELHRLQQEVRINPPGSSSKPRKPKRAKRR